MIRATEVDAQLRRILGSSAFVTSARSRQFLEFCVDRALRGQTSDLKETTIAVEVFLRSADYDPKRDPIVRVHARRVREKLDLYYRTAGSEDPIKIDIPKGGYVPQILRTLPTRKMEFGDWDEQEAMDEAARRRAISKPQTERAASRALAVAKISDRMLIGGLMLGVALVSFAIAWVSRSSPSRPAPAIGALQPMDSLPGNATDASCRPMVPISRSL